MNHLELAKEALKKARESVAAGGFPAGAVIARGGKIVGVGISIGNKLNDPTSHGELSAIRNACQNLATSNLSDCVLYASMEPCSMCHSACMWSHLSKIVFACRKGKVSDEYYGGHYHTDTLNETFDLPIEIAHISEFEEESLAIVREWEKGLTSS